MNAREVIQLAKEWVEQYGSTQPGFCGAHLVGGINYSPIDALFADYKDVDMNLLFTDMPEGDNQVHDLSFKGLILEYGSSDARRYRSAEAVLADPGLACNLAVNSILSDPTGMLAPVQAIVAHEYPCEKWVRARCEEEKKKVTASLEIIRQASSASEAILPALEVGTNLSGLMASACLKPPTHRRHLVVLRDLLKARGLSDLHEELLAAIGYSNFSRSQVEGYLTDCGAIFDKAVEVTRTPFPLQFKLHSHVRPYFIQGIQEMLDEDAHREAMYWVAACLWIANTAIQMDGSEEDKAHFLGIVYPVVGNFDWNTSQDIASRYQRVRAVAEKIFAAADEIVRNNPEINHVQ
jgi:hypothetical protein